MAGVSSLLMASQWELSVTDHKRLLKMLIGSMNDMYFETDRTILVISAGVPSLGAVGH